MGSLIKQKVGISRRTFIAGSIGSGLAMGYGSLLSGCSQEQATESLVTGDLSKIFSPAVWFEIDSR